MKTMKNSLIRLSLVLGMCCLLSISNLTSMDLPPQAEKSYVFVKTNAGEVIPVEQWQITQMKTLLVLLEHQKGANSYANPLDASMLTSAELRLLIDAFRAAKEQVFEEFFMDLAQQDGLLDRIENKPLKIKYTLGEGVLRSLVNATEKADARSLTALCGSYYLPEDMQKLLVAKIVPSMADFFREQILKTIDEEAVVLKFDRNTRLTNYAFSPDNKKIYVACYFRDNRNDQVEVWDLSQKELIKTFIKPTSSQIAQMALSADGTMCAEGGQIDTIHKPGILIWDTRSGKLISKYTDNNRVNDIQVLSLAFNPANSNQLVFSYGLDGDQPIHLLDIEQGTTTPLIGVDKVMTTLSFSADGSTILGYNEHRRIACLWDVATRKMIAEI